MFSMVKKDLWKKRFSVSSVAIYLKNSNRNYKIKLTGLTEN